MERYKMTVSSKVISLLVPQLLIVPFLIFYKLSQPSIYQSCRREPAQQDACYRDHLVSEVEIMLSSSTIVQR